jgi:hypothetical protein
MSEEPNSLDPDVLAVLLRAEPLTELSNEAKTRMRATIDARVAALPVGGPAPDGNGGAAGAASSSGVWIASHPWIALSTVFLVGGAVGLFARGALPERVIYVDRVTAPTSSITKVPSSSSHEIAGVPVEALPVASAAPERTAAAASGQQLAAENALLDLARTAVARGEPDRALDAIDRHAARFPRGLLSEEREALAIKALVLAGRPREARERAALFRDRYPGSLFLRSIDASLASIR